MAEEVLRLGVDPKGGVRGMNQFRRSAGATQLSATQLATSIGVLGGAMAAFAGARGVGTAINAAIEWEMALTGVAKTVEATEDRIASLGGELQDLSTTIPVAAGELAGIAEAAGQLGIQTDNIVSFTRVMADLGVATNLTAEQAATSLARLANVMGTPQSAFDRLGATIVDLGNNLATTEAEITEFATRMAGAGRIAGLTEANILAIGGAMSSVGIEAEAGGTAVQKALIDINTAVAQGNESLSVFADVAGMSATEFQGAWRDDAGSAFTAFVEGLGRAGDDATTVLDSLGLSNQRLVRAFLSLANAGPLLRDSIGRANVAWEENNALTAEAERFYATLGNQIQILKNQVGVAAADIGEEFVPALELAIENVDLLVDATRALVTVVGVAFVGQLGRMAVSLAGEAKALLASAAATAQKNRAMIAATASEVAAAQAALRYGVVTTDVTAAESARTVATIRLANAQRASAAATTAAAGATTTLGASIKGLFAAIGPVGWLLLGLGTAATAITVFNRQSREMREELERQRKAVREAADAMGTLDEAATRATLSNLGLAASSITADIQRLKAEIAEAPGPTGRGTGGTERAALQAQLREQQKRLEELDPLIAAAGRRWTEFGSEAEAAADAVGGVETAAAGIAGSLDDEIDLLARAVDLGVAQAEQFERLLEIQSQQRRILDDQTSSLTEQVVAAERRLEAERAIDRFISSRSTGREVGAPGTTSLTGGDIVVPEVERLIEDTGRLAAVLHGAGAETDNWAESIDPAVRGIIAVADGFGLIEGRARDAVRGLSDIAGGISSLQGAADSAGGFGEALSTAGGIASLLPGAGQIIGGVAGLIGGLLGGGPSAEELEQMRLAEERNRILEQNRDSVRRLEQRLGPTMERLTTNLESAFAAGGLDLGGLGSGDIAEGLMDILVGQGTGTIPITGISSRQDIENLADQLDIDILDPEGGFNTDALEQLAEKIGLVMEQIQRAQDTFRDELEVRRLLAQGMDEEAAARRRMLEDQAEIEQALAQGFDDATIAALEEVQALEEEARAKEAAARAAEEAARQERQRAATLSDFAARAAALEGEDIEALRIRREAAAAQEVAALEELLEAGTITADEFERFAGVLDEEVIRAVEDATEAQEEAARAAREAAEAERFRAMVDMENLRVRNLVARGMDEEAQALRAQLEIMQAVNEGRSEEFIQLLRQTLAIEAQNDAERERRQAIEETTRAIDGMTRTLNAPAGFSAALRRAQTTGVGSPIFGVQSPNFQQPIQGGDQNLVVNVTAAPGQNPQEIAEAVINVWQQQARATGVNPADSIGVG